MTITPEPLHAARVVSEPQSKYRAACVCGFVGTSHHDADEAWQQAVEHEMQNMGDIT